MVKISHLGRLYTWLDRISKIRYYPFVLGFCLMIVSLTLVFPHFTIFNSNSEAWQTVNLKSQDLTNSLEHLDPYGFMAKKVFRLTVPVIMKITQLPPLAVLMLQFLLGYLLIVFCYKLSLRILKDSVMATLIATGIVFLYFGRAAFYDTHWTWFDGFSYFFLVITLYSRNLLGIFFFATAASWTDERAFIALGIALLFHQVADLDKTEFTLGKFFRLNPRSLAVLAAMGGYIGLRMLLTSVYGMYTPSSGANLSMLARTLPFMTVGSWTFLEGFWLMFVYAIWKGFQKRDFTFSLLLVIIALGFTVMSGCVTDITRTGSYMVPVIFVFAVYLKPHMETSSFRLLTLGCVLASLLFPALIVCADWNLELSLQYSVFVLILRHLLNYLVQNNVIK